MHRGPLLHRATACTDVTGFGLAGHLVEMLRQSPGVGAQLFLGKLPALDGVEETMHANFFSSLQPQNLRARRAIKNAGEASRLERYQLLFDPQTAGGLLVRVPAPPPKIVWQN